MTSALSLPPNLFFLNSPMPLKQDQQAVLRFASASPPSPQSIKSAHSPLPQNPALDKSRSKARIDALSAAVIASGLREIHAKRKKSGFRLVVAR